MLSSRAQGLAYSRGPSRSCGMSFQEPGWVIESESRGGES